MSGRKRLLLSVLPPVVLAAAFIPLSRAEPVMTFAARRLGGPWRFFFGKLTARVPFSVTEVLVLLLILWLVFAVARLFRLKTRPLFALFTTVLYAASVFLWVGCAGYFAAPLYGGVLTNRGITVSELAAAAEYFRDGANRTAGQVRRAPDGGFDVGVDEILLYSDEVFDNLTADFPLLLSSAAAPKTLFTSGLMSRTGFTGVYFALTGEANVNKFPPRALLAVTVAHELAHSRGVAREDAANFFGIAACVTSGVPVYEYSGYLDGLLYLGNALYSADADAYYKLSEGYSDLVRRDLKDNSDYWAEILDKNDKNPAMAAVSAAVNTAYDGFMRANAQENGIKTYGECVDLLAEWAILRGVR